MDAAHRASRRQYIMVTMVAMQTQESAQPILIWVALVLLVLGYLVSVVYLVPIRTILHRRPLNYKAVTAINAITMAIFLFAIFIEMDRRPHVGWILLAAIGWLLGVVYVYFVLRSLSKRHEKQRRG
jgi:hypothetical protein